MNCREFHEHLEEYLEPSLEPARQRAASTHLASCLACRATLQRAQQARRSIQHALESSAAAVSLDAAARARILRAAAQPVETPGLLGTAWHWFRASPLRGLAAAALLGGLFIVAAFELHSRARPSARPVVTYTIDVPFETAGVKGVTHVQFSTSAD